MDKTKRKLEIYKFINNRGRTWTGDIVAHIENKFEIVADSKLKQAIYRDLKSLVESHEVGINLFTPKGDPIAPEEEDQHSNFRSEYFSLNTPLDGIRGQVHQGHSHFFTSFLLKDSLTIDSQYSAIPPNHYVLSYEFSSGKIQHLRFPLDERPVRIVVGRSPDDPLSFQEKVQQEKKKRILLLNINHKSISRFKDNFEGHGAIEFLRELDQIKIEDHRSSQGVFSYQADKSFFEKINFSPNDTLKVNISLNAFEKIEGEKEMNAFAIIHMGLMQFYISRT